MLRHNVKFIWFSTCRKNNVIISAVPDKLRKIPVYWVNLKYEVFSEKKLSCCLLAKRSVIQSSQFYFLFPQVHRYWWITLEKTLSYAMPLCYCIMAGNICRYGKPITYKIWEDSLSSFWPVPATRLLSRFKVITDRWHFLGPFPIQSLSSFTILDTEIVYFYKHKQSHASWPEFLDMFNLLV